MAKLFDRTNWLVDSDTVSDPEDVHDITRIMLILLLVMMTINNVSLQ